MDKNKNRRMKVKMIHFFLSYFQVKSYKPRTYNRKFKSPSNDVCGVRVKGRVLL